MKSLADVQDGDSVAGTYTIPGSDLILDWPWPSRPRILDRDGNIHPEANNVFFWAIENSMTAASARAAAKKIAEKWPSRRPRALTGVRP